MIVECQIDPTIDGISELSVVSCVFSVRVKRRAKGIEALSTTRKLSLVLMPTDDAQLTAEELFASVRRTLRPDVVRIGGLVPESIRLDRAELSFDDDERLSFAEVRASVNLPEPLHFPFIPGRVSPSRPDDPPFEEALVAAYRAVECPLVVANTVETDRYWLFPIRQIGSLGAIVDRRTAKASAMGSAFPLEVWVWAWEQGLMDDSIERVVLEECSEAALFREAVSHVYRLTVDELARLPLSLANDWRAWGAFYELRTRLRVRPDKMGG